MLKYDANDVVMFVAAAEAGTLSGAAKELGVPTSTVSRSLTRLEQRLQMLLINRSSKGLVLTDPGTEYLEACRHSLRALSNGNEQLDRHRLNPTGVIRIACPGTMVRHLLTPMMAKLLSAFPNLKIDLQEYVPTHVPFPRLDVDIIFMVSPPNDSSRMIRSYPSTKRGLFASKGYLREFGLPKVPLELVNHRCIGIDKWELTNDEMTTPLPVIFHVTTGDPVVSRQLAIDGVGIVVLPFWMAKAPPLRDALVHVLPGWTLSPIPLVALYCRPNALTPKIKNVLNFLNEFIGTDRDPRLEHATAAECFIGSASRSDGLRQCNTCLPADGVLRSENLHPT
jgi:LysR family transcriptional regulator, transcriptional activator for dmlA